MPRNARGHLRFLTPINLDEEKEKFFDDQSYAPQLAYNWDAHALQRYMHVNPDLAVLFHALYSQDRTMIDRAGQEFFDVKFRPQDLELAEATVRHAPRQSHGTIHDVARLMAEALHELGIHYNVELADKQGFQCRPDHARKVVSISKFAHMQFLSPESLTRHELTHVIRAVNGKYNGITPQPGYLPTDEGLGCLVEDRFLERPTGSLFQHALEYLATDLSRRAGFHEVYDFLRQHGCDAESAWSRGIRQKFGLRDTSMPGSFLRTGMYFYHAQLLSHLSQDEILRLFVGKIPQTRLAEYPVYTGQVPWDRLVAFLQRSPVKELV